jgi:murein endopeptidase
MGSMSFRRRIPLGAALAAAIAMSGCAGRSRPPATSASTAKNAAGSNRPAERGAPDCDDGVPDAAADSESGHTTLDDGFDAPTRRDRDLGSTSSGGPGSLPLANLRDAAIADRLRADLGALGPMSIGRAHGGVLVAAVRMPEGANWKLVSPGLAWGTKETVDALAHAIDAVATRFPSSPPAFIGDISAKNGGHLHPHISHQAGRDVDLGYYLTEGHRPYASANGTNLDRPRTWHLVRTLIAETDVDLILVDTQVQRVLKSYALEIGEDPAWLDQIFQVGGKSSRPLVFHAKGHVNHMHVRFYNPVAQELGRRAYPFLVARRIVSAPTLFLAHTTKPGETLSHLSARYKVTVDAIKKANALSTDLVVVNKPYKIPQTGGGIAMPGPIAIPARRIPPSPNPEAAAARGSVGREPCRAVSSNP